jgi:uncharacterized protein
MRGRFLPITLGLALACATGCIHVGPRVDEPWRLYALSPMPPGDDAAANGSSRSPARRSLGVGPIHLPGYLDQDQIVTRISPNRLTLSDDARWIEPLYLGMGRVLAENLSQLLQAEQVTVRAWPARERPVYQLEVDVLSFETDTSGMAQLAARWYLRDVASGGLMAERQVRLTASAPASSSEHTVAALSQALGDFSREIAGAIGESLRTVTSGSRAAS